jgi:hypothetical protein
MDKVQKYNPFNTNTPSSESYRNYLGKNMSEAFPIQNGPKQDFLSPSFFNFASEYVIRKDWK